MIEIGENNNYSKQMPNYSLANLLYELEVQKNVFDPREFIETTEEEKTNEEVSLVLEKRK